MGKHLNDATKDFPQTIEVTKQKIDISGLSDLEKKYFLDFRNRLIEIYNCANQDRVAVSLSGISGTGKSVTAAIVSKLIDNLDLDFVFYQCGLDAFHYTNCVLDSMGLSDVKGRYDTYDLEKLHQKLIDFKAGREVSLPIYSREKHNPIDDVIHIKEKRVLLLIEGLWFLRDDDAWGEIRQEFHKNFMIDGSNIDTKTNVLKRHVRGGRSQADAERFYENSDSKNTEEILKNSIKADEVLYYNLPEAG